jgi:hypothetical protein
LRRAVHPGDGAPPAVALEDGIAVAGLLRPRCDHVVQEAVEPVPGHVGGSGERRQGGAEERDDRRRTDEFDCRVAGRPGRRRTQLPPRRRVVRAEVGIERVYLDSSGDSR